MKRFELNDVQWEQGGFALADADSAGYGLALQWMSSDAAQTVRQEVIEHFDPKVTHRIFSYDEGQELLPPATAFLTLVMGEIARTHGLTPKQVAVNTQLPRATGIGHFDLNTKKSLVATLNNSEVAMLRPSDAIPAMNQDAQFTYIDAHKLWVPARALLAFAGPRMPGAVFHRVCNPTDDVRVSVAVGCH